MVVVVAVLVPEPSVQAHKSGVGGVGVVLAEQVPEVNEPARIEPSLNVTLKLPGTPDMALVPVPGADVMLTLPPVFNVGYV